MLLLHRRLFSSGSSHAAASSVKNHMSKQAAVIVAVGGAVVFVALAGHKSTIADKPKDAVAAVPANAVAQEKLQEQAQRQAKLKEIKHRVLQLSAKLDAVENDVREYQHTRSIKA